MPGNNTDLVVDGENVIRAVIVSTQGDSGSLIDPRLVWLFLLGHWLLLALATILGGIAVFAASYALPRVYRAETLLAPVAEEGNSLRSLAGTYGALASAIGIDLGGSSSDTSQVVAQLQSRQFIEQFITDESLLPVLYPKVKFEASAASEKKPTLQDAYYRFMREILLVREDKSTKLVTVRVDWRNPEVAADWANKLVARINAVTRADAILQTERSLAYLREALDKADYVSARSAISSVIEAQINKRMLAQTRPDYSFRVIDPAKPSDANKYASPRRLVLAALGMMLGLMAGLWFSFLKESRARSPKGSAGRNSLDRR
jgi:uncharacterized protein involved in exopolysaccharide biosynthesis